MKKLGLLVAAIIISATTVFAQKGEKSVGVNLGYGLDIESVKIGANFKYNFTDEIRVAPSFDYFLKKNNVTMWAVNADANYLFNVAEGIKVYPLAGLALVGVSFDGFSYDLGPGMSIESDGVSNTELGINLGAGADFRLTEVIDFNVEAKYQIVDNWNQLVLSVGVSYKF
jgi:outer membrane autotransporter barrel domain